MTKAKETCLWGNSPDKTDSFVEKQPRQNRLVWGETTQENRLVCLDITQTKQTPSRGNDPGRTDSEAVVAYVEVGR